MPAGISTSNHFKEPNMVALDVTMESSLFTKRGHNTVMRELLRGAIRLARRTRLAFLRLSRLVEADPELPFSKWTLYAVRRINVEVAVLRNSLDPMAILRLEGRKERRSKRNPLSSSARRRIRNWLREAHGDPRCAYCGVAVSAPTLDHSRPRCQGGSNSRENIVLACSTCNEAKGDRTPEQWADDVLSARERAGLPAKG
jgi:hypothetical protein